MNQSLQALAKHAGLGVFFVHTDECVHVEGNSSAYCHYVAFIIFLGYLFSLLVLPLTLNRMHTLKNKFRNQYNLSFNWLCALLLVSAIDLMEFMMSRDSRVFSIFIVLILTGYFFLSILTLISHFNVTAINGTRRTNMISISASVVVFLAIVILRLLSKTIQGEVNLEGHRRFNLIKFMPYYLVYAFLGGVQVLNNFKHSCARCFTNLGYAAWVLGAFCLSFYSLILPASPAYDYIHYRNYFLMTSILFILLQDVYFLLNRLSERETRQYLNSITSNKMYPISSTTASGNHYRGLKQLDAVFENQHESTTTPSSSILLGSSKLEEANNELVMDEPTNIGEKLKNLPVDEEDDNKEDVVYQASQFDKHGAKTGQVTSNLYRLPSEDPVYNSDLVIRIRVPEERGLFGRTLNRINKKLLIISFALLLIAGIIFSTIGLLKSTVFSIYSVTTILFYPSLFTFYFVNEKFLKK